MLGMGILIAFIASSCGTQKEKIKGDRDVISVNGRPWLVVLRTFDREEPADLWDAEVQDRLRNL